MSLCRCCIVWRSPARTHGTDNYSVDVIYGIKSGFRGFYEEKYLPYLKLTPASTDNIHKRGGTMLGSSRGGFDAEKIVNAALEHGINQIYCVGGDGTHRAANILYEYIRKRNLKISIACIPKTVDNDIGVIDRSFGFNTALEYAVDAIESARTEAKCTPNGIGIVKLMGRHAGFISAYATLADRNVDLCLIPEDAMPLDASVLPHIESVVKKTGHCVVVVSEGAGETLCKDYYGNGTDLGQDESGNAILPPIGKFLQESIGSYFAARDIRVNIKYHDPSYMIRSVPAAAADSVYCMILAQNACHGVMAGYTGFSSGLVNNRTCMIPLLVIVHTSPTHLNSHGRTWERVTRSTHQPTDF